MALTQTAIFLDSANIDWQGGLGWVEYPEDQFMGGSTAWGRFNDSTWIAATFHGTMVTYFGNGVERVPWNYTAIVDGGDPEGRAISQLPGYEQNTFQWYTSATMGEGEHLVNLTGITQGAAIDYVVVQPSLTQNVKGQVLIVDNKDPQIKYTGSWREVTDRYQRIPNRVVAPFNGTVHTTNKVGDVLQFPFTGSGVSLYGFFDWMLSGEFGLSYAFDDQPAEVVQYPPIGATQGSFLVQPNFLFYSKSIAAGDHVLTVNVTELTGGQKVMIDMIQYNATFDTIATMPQVPLPDIVLPSSAVSPSAILNQSGKGVNIGAIVGGVVGGVVTLGLAVIALAIFLHRRKRSLDDQVAVTPYQLTSEANLVTEPFISPITGGTRLEWNNGSSLQLSVPPTKPGSHSVVPSASTSSLPSTSRVENLERRLEELARQLEKTGSPPPYQ